MNEIKKGWMTLKEGADYAKVSCETLRRAARCSRIKFGMVGGNYRFMQTYIDDFLLMKSH